MPKMNGIELAQKIRETSDIPIILYTGQGSEEVAELAFSVGIDDYLRKEFARVSSKENIIEHSIPVETAQEPIME